MLIIGVLFLNLPRLLSNYVNYYSLNPEQAIKAPIALFCDGNIIVAHYKINFP